MLRNREFQWFAVLFCCMAGVAVALGFTINAAAGFLAAGCAAAFGAAFLLFTKARYKRIARLSHQIDLVLHHADYLDLDELEEGELSILYSEINKMLLRIREQNETLAKEKVRLADSLADIAHQLRTPLTSANLILSLLAGNSDGQERRELMREAEELFLQIDWLLTSLLKLSRLDAGVAVFQSGPVDVNDLLRDAVRPFQIPMELHEITVHVTAPQGMTIQGDRDWLAEALQNILKNCLESAGEGGCIEIACVDNPLHAEITVRDDGPGIEKEDLPFLFDRYYRGKASRAGYGIGLALCKTILTRQGGTITAKNHPRGGAVFAIRFPK